MDYTSQNCCCSDLFMYLLESMNIKSSFSALFSLRHYFFWTFNLMPHRFILSSWASFSDTASAFPMPIARKTLVWTSLRVQCPPVCSATSDRGDCGCGPITRWSITCCTLWTLLCWPSWTTLTRPRTGWTRSGMRGGSTAVWMSWQLVLILAG